MTDPFTACEEEVRRHDPDRYFAALFAPEKKRRHLFALCAFYRELVHAAQAACEPMILDIRLAWWRETLEGARLGKPRDHHVAQALAVTLSEHALPPEIFERMIEARAADTGAEPFADAAAAEDHADATSGSLMRLAARVLGTEADAVAREAGIAYALAGRSGGKFANIDSVALAKKHFNAARKLPMPRAALPAFLPAALVRLYLTRPDPALWRKQIAYLRAAMVERI
jgi:phytoene/squalene synthetase